jgi:hypothetical protein
MHATMTERPPAALTTDERDELEQLREEHQRAISLKAVAAASAGAAATYLAAARYVLGEVARP